MTARYVASGGGGAAVTLGLFLLMQTLIASGPARLNEVKSGRIVDLVRLNRDSETRTKDRELPDRKPPDKPPPPDMDLSDLPKPASEVLAVAAPPFEASLDLVGGPALDMAASDTDVVPLVRVNPQYPPDAMLRGIEGWVHVRFSITEAGTVKDVEVVGAEPRGYFERAAMNAVHRYKYKPRIENGVAVERSGIELVISFKLKKT